MAEITITRRSGVTLTMHLDDADLDRVTAAGPWCTVPSGYAVRGGRKPDGTKTLIYLHRWLLEAPTGLLVDHVNGNKLDNRRANLRLATSQENNRNRRLGRNSTSGLKGASWCARERLWHAQIQVSGRNVSLGYHASKLKAHEAYRKAAANLFGVFANFGERE
jgi:hypothetical protein